MLMRVLLNATCVKAHSQGRVMWWYHVKFVFVGIIRSVIRCVLILKRTPRNYAIIKTKERKRTVTFVLSRQPVIESASASWICKKCRKKQNCQLLANTVTHKTVSSTLRKPSLPSSYENKSYKVSSVDNKISLCVYKYLQLFFIFPRGFLTA